MIAPGWFESLTLNKVTWELKHSDPSHSRLARPLVFYQLKMLRNNHRLLAIGKFKILQVSKGKKREENEARQEELKPLFPRPTLFAGGSFFLSLIFLYPRSTLGKERDCSQFKRNVATAPFQGSVILLPLGRCKMRDPRNLIAVAIGRF